MPARTPRERLNVGRFISFFFFLTTLFLGWRWLSLESQLSTPEYLAERANRLQQSTDVGRHAQMVLEDRQLAREELLRLQALGRRIDEQLTLLAQAVPASAAKLSEIRDTPAGSKIAADPSSLQQFQTLTDEYVPDPAAVENLRKRFDELMVAVAEPLSAGQVEKQPEQKLTERLQAIADEVAQIAERNDVLNKRLAALFAGAPETNTTDSQSIAEALAAVEAQWAAELNRQAEAAAEQVRAEYAAKHVAEKAETQRKLEEIRLAKERKIREEELKAAELAAKIEAQKIADAAADARRAEEARRVEREAVIEREKREAEFQAALPEIKRYLVPFITDGHQQLANGKWSYSAESKPLSLGALRAAKILSNDQMGHMNFYWMAASQSNDRPTGLFRGNYIGGAVRSELIPDVVKAQALLEQYGDMLVEKQMLLP